jgi:hypothetical protein
LSFVFCLLSFVFCLLSFVFCLLSFVFCLLSIVCLCLIGPLSFVFCLLSIVSCPESLSLSLSLSLSHRAVVYCLLSVVCCLLSVVFCLLSFVFCLLSFVFCLLSIVSVFCLIEGRVKVAHFARISPAGSYTCECDKTPQHCIQATIKRKDNIPSKDKTRTPTRQDHDKITS